MTKKRQLKDCFLEGTLFIIYLFIYLLLLLLLLCFHTLLHTW